MQNTPETSGCVGLSAGVQALALREVRPPACPGVSPGWYVSEVSFSERSELLRNHRRGGFCFLWLERKRDSRGSVPSWKPLVVFRALPNPSGFQGGGGGGGGFFLLLLPPSQGTGASVKTSFFPGSRFPCQDSLPSLLPARGWDHLRQRGMGWGVRGSGTIGGFDFAPRVCGSLRSPRLAGTRSSLPLPVKTMTMINHNHKGWYF